MARSVRNSSEHPENKSVCYYMVAEVKANHLSIATTEKDYSTIHHLKLPREFGNERLQTGQEQEKGRNGESLTSGSKESTLSDGLIPRESLS